TCAAPNASRPSIPPSARSTELPATPPPKARKPSPSTATSTTKTSSPPCKKPASPVRPSSLRCDRSSCGDKLSLHLPRGGDGPSPQLILHSALLTLHFSYWPLRLELHQDLRCQRPARC